MVRTEEGTDLYLCTKFEAIALIVQKLLGGPKMSNFGHTTQATLT